MITLKHSVASGNSPDLRPSKSHDILTVVNVSKRFGGLSAIDNFSFALDQPNITSLIGPNGAGKTSLINIISGVYAASSGAIYFQGHDITQLSAYGICYLGVVRTFQLMQGFTSLTVLENVMVGCHTRSRIGMLSSGLRLPFAKKEERRIRDEAFSNLSMVGLEHRASDQIASLPLGERKLVGIAQVLGSKPKLLMMDEPVGGLAAHEIRKMTELIYGLIDNGLTILIVEHNMPFVMSISNRVIVMAKGRKLADGPPDSVRSKAEVISAYLGEE